MNINNPISAARIKKQKNVLAYLSLAFKGFAYPVYLFGSYATGRFHGESDVDIAIIAPDAQAKDVYNQACDKMTGLGMNYGILISSSINHLDSSMATSLQGISATAPCVALPPASMQSSASSLNALEDKSKSIGLSFLASTKNKVHSSTYLLENRQPYKPLPPPQTYRRQTGLTLIEIMVAMLIGLFLLGGVLQVFVGSKQTNRMLEALSRIQENGRYAMGFLNNDIRMAGFLGCDSGIPLTNKLNLPAPPGDFLYRFDRAIDGFEATSPAAWTPAINAAITSPLGGSDVVTIRRAADQSFTVVAHAAATAGLTLDATATIANLQAADFLKVDTTNYCASAIVTNCAAATIFQANTVAANLLSQSPINACALGNADNDLGRTYGNGEVYPIHTISYYIRLNASLQPALYRRIDARNAEELVEGIEQMQILYGEDLDAPGTAGYGSANYYVPADSIPAAGWGRVVSIRISLVAVSLEDNVTLEPVAYFFNGGSITPPDHRLRRVFTSTIAVRNRL
ncbi:MAG: PilW family protein [Methylovulum sp.]|uniref:PilW family protein n=1 Tax=Methylovulum sp. TaxID=1916980 RepID=UPI00262ACCF6|nr:PilW family protein [Methylovulum sp.]MDD2724765.1 PilW family protein [Methylovulum sp.]MDD5124373.1 PilW family protein [Methylovulum sp.]